MQTIWKNCGILFGKIVAFHLEELRQTQFSLIYTRQHLYRQSSHICGNFNISKIAFGSACRALVAAELRFMSASGRFMHLWCVSCGGAAGIKRQLMTIMLSISVNYAPFVDWKNVQRTLAIQNEMLSYAAEPRGVVFRLFR